MFEIKELILINYAFPQNIYMIIINCNTSLIFTFCKLTFPKYNINQTSYNMNLGNKKPLEVSEQSISHDNFDSKNLVQVIEEKDRKIRKLSKKIVKLEETIKKMTTQKGKSNLNQVGSMDQDVQLQFMKEEMEKIKQLQYILEEITARVSLILGDLSQDNSMTDNSEQIREMLMMMQNERNSSFSQNSQYSGSHRSINIQQDWSKKMDILQGAFRSFKNKFLAIKSQNKQLTEQLVDVKKTVQELSKKPSDSEEMQLIKEELKQERKQRQKLRILLDTTQRQKNELINKINSIGNNAQIRAKTKEELLQYSKELNYRVNDLQKQKQAILKETNKEKSMELKKYEDFLKRLKVIKEKSKCGKSFA